MSINLNQFLRIFILACFISIPSGSVLAQRIYIDIGAPDSKPLPIAITDFIPQEKDTSPSIGQELQKILENDLAYTGLFHFLDKKAFLENTKEETTLYENIKFQNWEIIGARALIKAGYHQKKEQVILEVHVYDIDTQNRILSKKYQKPQQELRKLVHQASNDLLKAFTGEKSIFSSRIAMSGKTSYGKEIFVMDMDGANITQQSQNHSINLSPAWSPNGKSLVFTGYKHGSAWLYLMDLANGKQKILSSYPGINSSATWSPDGKTLAVTLSKDGNSELYLIKSDGSIIRRLTRNFWIDVSPTWSPGGEMLAFVASKSGSPQIYVMDKEGNHIKRLTYAGKHNESPAWSPRGDLIAFAGRDEGFFDIFIMNVDGSRIRRLTSLGTGNNEHPTWAPDGRHIAFSSNRDGTSRIYVMNRDGTHQKALTPPEKNFTEPNWSSF